MSHRTRLSVDVSPGLHKRVKLRAAEQNTSMSRLIEAALECYLSSHKPNEETIRAMEETDRGVGLVGSKDKKDLYKKLGLL